MLCQFFFVFVFCFCFCTFRSGDKQKHVVLLHCPISGLNVDNSVSFLSVCTLEQNEIQNIQMTAVTGSLLHGYIIPSQAALTLNIKPYCTFILLFRTQMNQLFLSLSFSLCLSLNFSLPLSLSFSLSLFFFIYLFFVQN